MAMEVDRDNLIVWLQELIRIPSVTGEEADIAHYVGQELEKMGFHPDFKENNVFFEVGEGPKSLLLNAHLDTVNVGGEWSRDPFGAHLSDGKIHGRGASDDKGNIAAMLEIARLSRKKLMKGRLIFTFTTGEEYGAKLESKGSFILSQFLKADRALILEPQTDVGDKMINVIYGCRGIENMLLQVKGKASHTGYPERGINAISLAIELLSRVESIDFHKVEASGQEIETICMPIRIRGGADIFLVPDSCEIVIHCRTAPEDNRIFGQIEQLCQEVCDENFALQRTYSAPGYIENPDDRLVDIIRQESKKLGYSSQNRFAGGRIDASIFKAVGHIPSYCMGAGNRDQMHLVDEYITVEDFIACSELVKNIVFSYLS
jgi:acetylornithine deacetylase/succinyl-diaminopimelate desuccinylase-like protein